MSTPRTTSQGLPSLLARMSIPGFLLQLLWVLIAGPISLSRWDRPSTYLSLAMALFLVILCCTSRFRSYLASQAKDRAYPVRAFLANGFSISVVALFLLIQLGTNRHLFTSWRSATDLIFLGGALLIALASLVANVIAYHLDRRHAGRSV